MSAKHLPPHHQTPGPCRRYLEAISDYVDGVLDDGLCHELEAHMASCENCRVVVNTFAKTITLYQQLPTPEMPTAVKDRLYHVLSLQDYLTAPKQPGD